MTHALLPGSPAIDAGDASFNPADPDGDPMTDDALPYDQRGEFFSRVYDGDASGVAFIDMGALELHLAPPVAPGFAGDYNRNNVADAADYVVWRKTLGAVGVPAFSGADANGNGTIDDHDFDVWEEHFGEAVGASSMERGAGSEQQTGRAGEQQSDREPVSEQLRHAESLHFGVRIGEEPSVFVRRQAEPDLLAEVLKQALSLHSPESGPGAQRSMPVSETLAHVAAALRDADGQPSARHVRPESLTPALSPGETGQVEWRDRALVAWLDSREITTSRDGGETAPCGSLANRADVGEVDSEFRYGDVDAVFESLIFRGA